MVGGLDEMTGASSYCDFCSPLYAGLNVYMGCCDFIISTTSMVIALKGNEEYLYIAFIQRLVPRRSDMDHTVLPANYTMPAFPS